MLSLDIFAKKPQLRLPNGEKKYKTCIGWFFTIIYIAGIAAYLYFDTNEKVEFNFDGDADKNMMRMKPSVTSVNTLSSGAATSAHSFKVPAAVGVVDPEDPGFALDPSIAKLSVY